MSFQSPHEYMSHNNRKRSVFALGTVSGKKSYVMGSKRKPPPSSSRSLSRPRRLSLFQNISPSFSTTKQSHHNDSTGTGNTKQPQAPRYSSEPLIPRGPLFTDLVSASSFDTRDTSSCKSNSDSTSRGSDQFQTGDNNIKESTNKENDNNHNQNRRHNIMDLSPMQSEVTVLRQKLHVLGNNNKRSELLLGQVKVLEEESQRKDEKLRYLNDKLHGIQRGLSQIDEERTTLQTQIKALEEEKYKIQCQLDLRDQEVLTLVRRCSTQEEKMRETTLLRYRNAELTQEIEQLRAAMDRQESERNSWQETKRELEDCQQKLEHAKKDHDTLANTLQNCLANIKQLTKEKEEWKDERRRLLHRAEEEVEKERLHHVGQLNELKVQLQSRQDKIDKLEEFMKDKSMTNLMLRKEIAELNKLNTQTSVKLEDRERKIVELLDENKGKFQEIEQMSDDQSDWISKLKEKELVIESLQDEVSKFMTRAMSTSETLEVLQEENEELEDLVEDLKKKLKSFDSWETEKDGMVECLSVTNQQIQELMEEVVTLQLAVDDLEEEKKVLSEKVELPSDDAMPQLKGLELISLEQEETWKSLEQDLLNQIRSLESEKIVMQEGLEAKLDDAKQSICALEMTVATRAKESENLKNGMSAVNKSEADKTNKIKALEQELSNATKSIDESQEERALQQKENEALKKKLNGAQQKLSESTAQVISLESKLAAAVADRSKNDETEEAMSALKKENSDLNRQLNVTLALNKELERDVAVLNDEVSRTSTVLQKKVEETQSRNSELQASLSTKEEQLGEARNALEEKIVESNESAEYFEKQLSDKDKQLTEALQSNDQHEKQMESLKTELQKVSMSLVLKDDEIRELRLIELKDCEEEISSLQEQLASKDTDIDSLSKRVQDLTVQQLERENEVSEELSTLKTTIATLKNEVETKTSEAQLLRTDGQALDSKNTALQRRVQLLEMSVESIRKEKELIVASENSKLNEKKKLELELQKETSLREEQGNALHHAQLQIDSLNEVVSTMKTQKEETTKLLMERSDLLTKMVEINKSLQSAADSLPEKNKNLAAFQEERARLADKLSNEESIREVLEAELSTVHSQISSMNSDKKELQRLKTENAELLAKIKRQESFLKKKIQQEKVMRDRTGSPRKTRSALKAPRQSILKSSLSENSNPNISIASEGGLF